MSDTTNSTDPVLEHLRQRKAQLQREQIAIDGRITEITDLILKLEDGRSSISRQRKARTAGNSSAPPPEPDGNSTADGMALINNAGSLRPDGQGPLPDPMRAEDAP